jgi:hypothetical protein
VALMAGVVFYLLSIVALRPVVEPPRGRRAATVMPPAPGTP